MWNKSSSSGEHSTQGVGLLLLLKFIPKLDPSTFCSSSAEQLRDCGRQQWCSCPLSPSLCYGDGFNKGTTVWLSCDPTWGEESSGLYSAASGHDAAAVLREPSKRCENGTERRGCSVCLLPSGQATSLQRSEVNWSVTRVEMPEFPVTIKCLPPFGHSRADKGDRSQLLKYVCMQDLCT